MIIKLWKVHSKLYNFLCIPVYFCSIYFQFKFQHICWWKLFTVHQASSAFRSEVLHIDAVYYEISVDHTFKCSIITSFTVLCFALLSWNICLNILYFTTIENTSHGVVFVSEDTILPTENPPVQPGDLRPSHIPKPGVKPRLQ